MKKSTTRVLTGIAILTGVFICGSAPSPANAQESANLPYMNPNLPAQERAIDLVHRMTLAEKASQLVNQALADSTSQDPGLQLLERGAPWRHQQRHHGVS